MNEKFIIIIKIKTDREVFCLFDEPKSTHKNEKRGAKHTVYNFLFVFNC